MKANLQFGKSFLYLAFLAMMLIISASTSVVPAVESSYPFEGVTTRSYSGAKPSKGKFLVADRKMGDPRFKETVILLIQHGPEGTVGLIINRPSEVKLSHAFPDMKSLQKRSDPLFSGGPVGTNQMFLLFRSETAPAESLQVFKDIYASSSMAILTRLAEDGKVSSFRVFGGYAGWGPGQLERELSGGDWHIMYADAETLFDKAPDRIWPELILRGSAIYVRLNP